MKRETKEALFTVAIAVLGVIIGVLLMASVNSYKEKKAVRNWKYGDWRKLSLVLEYVEKNYVDTIDMKKVTDETVSAALQALDPHSVYLPPVTLEASETELQGNFDGIGIQFNVPNDTAIVLNVIPGGPSEKAGILTGDRIMKVDDRPIAGNKTPQDTMVHLMRGPHDTKVKIGIRRGTEDIVFDITRDKIPVNCVDAHFMINDTTGYIKLSKFSRTTYTEVSLAAAELIARGMTKLVFDLRENSGGFLDQAYLLTNEFLAKNDMIVYTEGLHRERQDYKANGKGLLQDLPLTVLIDEGSASSSEIFAGAIQDNDRGVIIGRRSYGKGLVQEPVNFNDGSGIRLTVARFHTPSGRCIQKPYTDDYAYDLYNRYNSGELTDADSIKVNKDDVYYTKNGREVYGGGGIIPDIFVPMDTTKASKFYLACNKKATTMRFASDYFDRHRAELVAIEDFSLLEKYLSKAGLEQKFLDFAAKKDGLKPASKEDWEETKRYMLPQVEALVGRYSKVGENAFYMLYLPIDNTIKAAIEN